LDKVIARFIVIGGRLIRPQLDLIRDGIPFTGPDFLLLYGCPENEEARARERDEEAEARQLAEKSAHEVK